VMQVHRTTAEWLSKRRVLNGPSIGFIPTMGALHRGHASLVERCRAENDIVAVSIFVNPAQFDDPLDLDRYPRTMECDLALLESLGTDHVLVPAASDLYPEGYRFHVDFHDTEELMEQRHRPGFLQGVLTVVMKLLNLVRADRAYFGEKDFQQFRAVDEMAREFFVGTQIVPCPTVRAESGLAESSRNRRLSQQALHKAPWILKALTEAPTPTEARATLEAQGFVVDYVEERWGRRFAAARLEGVRLIDNVAIYASDT